MQEILTKELAKERFGLIKIILMCFIAGGM